MSHYLCETANRDILELDLGELHAYPFTPGGDFVQANHSNHYPQRRSFSRRVRHSARRPYARPPVARAYSSHLSNRFSNHSSNALAFYPTGEQSAHRHPPAYE